MSLHAERLRVLPLEWNLLGWTTIRADVRNVSDAIARGIVLSENLKRDDLTAIEQILADALWIDHDLCQHQDYVTLQIPDKIRTSWMEHVKTLSHDHQEAIVRLNYLLMKLDSDRRNNTDIFTNKFVGNVESAFRSLINPIEWLSFYQHDLTSYLKMDEEVKQVAVKKKLNKSQAKALNTLKKESQHAFQTVKETGTVTVHTGILTEETVAVEDASSRELTETTKAIRRKKRRAQKRQQLERIKGCSPPSRTTVTIHPGEWWQLGTHLLFCGDTSTPEFRSRLPESVPFAGSGSIVDDSKKIG